MTTWPLCGTPKCMERGICTCNDYNPPTTMTPREAIIEAAAKRALYKLQTGKPIAAEEILADALRGSSRDNE